MEAIILAGGLGTRLRSAVPDLPKPMAPIQGRPFLEYQIQYWIREGVRRFVLSVGYKREVIQSHFGSRYQDAEITYAIEDQPMGTGGGLLLAMNQLVRPGPFLAMNGDTFFEVDLKALQSFHDSSDAVMTISLREAENNCRYGQVQLDTASRITAFKPRPSEPSRTMINGGVYMMESTVFQGMDWSAGRPLSLEEQVLPGLLGAGKRIFGFQSPGRFIDIGVPDDYFRAAEMLVAH